MQYEKATRLNALINGLELACSIDMSAIYQDYINIETAKGIGLDNYGLLLNQSRDIYYEELLVDVFGFDTNSSPTYIGEPPETLDNGTFVYDTELSIISLTDDQYRKLLLIVYISSISSCSLGNINRILQAYFTNGIIYCNKTATMELTVFVDVELEAWEYQIIKSENILPRPLGCVLNIQKI